MNEPKITKPMVVPDRQHGFVGRWQTTLRKLPFVTIVETGQGVVLENSREQRCFLCAARRLNLLVTTRKMPVGEYFGKILGFKLGEK